MVSGQHSIFTHFDKDRTTAGCERHNNSGLERLVGAMKNIAVVDGLGQLSFEGVSIEEDTASQGWDTNLGHHQCPMQCLARQIREKLSDELAGKDCLCCWWVQGVRIPSSF